MPAGDPPPTAARPQTTPPTQTPPRRPLAPGPDFVTSSSGSGAFRALNFELYTVRKGAEKVHCACACVRAARTLRTHRVFFFPSSSSIIHHFFPAYSLQKPTGFVRTLSFAGTAVALGVVGYWLWETEVAQKQKSQQQKDRRV